jgi:hypothetical protein
MEYTKFGRTGLDVSRICLGCMSYGGGNLGNHAWSLPEEESRPFIKKALEEVGFMVPRSGLFFVNGPPNIPILAGSKIGNPAANRPSQASDHGYRTTMCSGLTNSANGLYRGHLGYDRSARLTQGHYRDRRKRREVSV